MESPRHPRIQLMVARFVDEGSSESDARWRRYTLCGNDLGQVRDRAPVTLFNSRSLAARAASLLSPQELEHASGLSNEEDRATYVGVHALLRIALARRIGAQPRQLGFRMGKFGKPLLEPETGAHFSVSYRRGWGALALADAPVGVDIEIMRPDGAGLEIAERWFHPDEATHLRGIDEDAVGRTFLELWTRKEALIKAAGLGVDYMPVSSALKSHARSMDEGGIARPYGIHQFASTADFALALAIQQ